MTRTAARDEIRVEVLDGVAEIPPEEWNALVGPASPFLEWEWLASLEDAGTLDAATGWGPKPLVIRQEGRLAAACPLYVKGHSEGEFVFDWGWADAAYRAGIEYYPKLVVGVPFTPVAGPRLLTAPGLDRAEWLPRLASALRGLCQANELSGVHVNFCLEDEREALEAAGFLPRLGFQYHWRNEGFGSFDDYLASLRSKRRNQVRRERRELAAQGVSVQVLTGDEIPDHLFPVMYRIYLSTIRSNPWGRQYLNERVFELLRERFRSRLCFVVARRAGEVVAGALNVEKDALYGRYWGAFQTLRHLHFNVCYYAGIEHCIRRGLPRFEPGAGGSYKQLRGFDATPTWSCHWLEHPGLRDAVGRFLAEERAEAGRTIEWYAENTALRRGDPERLAQVRRRLSGLSVPPESTP